MSVWLKAAPDLMFQNRTAEPKTRHAATQAGIKAWYWWEWILFKYCCAEHVKVEGVNIVRRLAERQQGGCNQGS